MSAGDRKKLIAAVHRGLPTSLSCWCAAHRSEICNGRKTVEFPTGGVRWRRRAPRIGVRDETSAVRAPRKAGMESFLRSRTYVSLVARSCETATATLPSTLGASRSGGYGRGGSWCVSLGRVCEGGMSRAGTALTSARVRLSAGRCDPVRPLSPHSETAPPEELERDKERRRLSALDAQVAREMRRGQKATGASLHFEPQLLRPAGVGENVLSEGRGSEHRPRGND